jgi:hypothetical protein
MHPIAAALGGPGRNGSGSRPTRSANSTSMAGQPLRCPRTRASGKRRSTEAASSSRSATSSIVHSARIILTKSTHYTQTAPPNQRGFCASGSITEASEGVVSRNEGGGLKLIGASDDEGVHEVARPAFVKAIGQIMLERIHPSRCNVRVRVQVLRRVEEFRGCSTFIGSIAHIVLIG